ncbi:hypothetical protein [Bacillus sp. V3B]|nr:hypothetical protein [Bacillus sp. V3B]
MTVNVWSSKEVTEKVLNKEDLHQNMFLTPIHYQSVPRYTLV